VEFPGGFKIGTASRRTGISSATLRVWEEQYGLLTPQRTGGGQRLYTEKDVDRVLYVRELISDRGYSLQAIAGILDEARHQMPPLVQDLLREEPGGESQRLLQMASELRAYLEDAHLRTATRMDQIREGEVLTKVQGVLRQVAQASTLAEAASVLVSGSSELIGQQPTTLALYQAADDSLRMVASARAGQNLATEDEPRSVAALVPAGFRTAVREGQPYYLRSVPADEDGQRAIASGVQSFYAHPLTAAGKVVGMLLVTSRRVDGVRADVRGICARLATISGPAIAYFAAISYSNGLSIRSKGGQTPSPTLPTREIPRP
jgi:DNA-binding transcriptional MerR regulator